MFNFEPRIHRRQGIQFGVPFRIGTDYDSNDESDEHARCKKAAVDKECDIFRKTASLGTYQKGRDKADVMRKASSLRNLDGPVLVCSLQSTKGHCVAVSQNM